MMSGKMKRRNSPGGATSLSWPQASPKVMAFCLDWHTEAMEAGTPLSDFDTQQCNRYPKMSEPRRTRAMAIPFNEQHETPMQ
jgi:hypothetical protein